MPDYRLRTSLLLAAVAFILRPTNLLIWIPISMQTLLNASNHNRWSLIIEAVGCGWVPRLFLFPSNPSFSQSEYLRCSACANHGWDNYQVPFFWKHYAGPVGCMSSEHQLPHSHQLIPRRTFVDSQYCHIPMAGTSTSLLDLTSATSLIDLQSYL